MQFTFFIELENNAPAYHGCWATSKHEVQDIFAIATTPLQAQESQKNQKILVEQIFSLLEEKVTFLVEQIFLLMSVTAMYWAYK